MLPQQLSSGVAGIPDDPIADHPRYEAVRYLNRGGHGFIILGRERDTGKYVALKFLPRATAATKYVEREIVNQFKLRYPHVIALEEIFLTDRHLVLVLEYADRGDLNSHVMSMEDGLGEDEARPLFQQLMLAVDFSHRMGVVNRDIKLENILLVGGLIKLADFGFSKDEIDHSAPATRVGTVMYCAPEVLTADGWAYDAKKADMWSCGVVLYAMLTSRYPFHRASDLAAGKIAAMNAAIGRILAGDYAEPAGVGPQCADLLRGLLTVDPRARYSMDQVFGHPWFVAGGLKQGVADFNARVIAELTANPPVNETVIAQVRKLLEEAKTLPGGCASAGPGSGSASPSAMSSV